MAGREGSRCIGAPKESTAILAVQNVPQLALQAAAAGTPRAQLAALGELLAGWPRGRCAEPVAS